MKTRICLLPLFIFATAFGVVGQTDVACPSLSITGPAGIAARGDLITFAANAEGAKEPLPRVKFDWTVSAGTIESGQGTNSIDVRVPSDGSVDKITATVRLGGLPDKCKNEFIEEAGVAPSIACGLPDIYPKLRRNDERARLFSAAHLLSFNPKAVLVFVVYLAPDESLADANRRATFIRNFFLKDKIIKSEKLFVQSDRLYLAFTRADDTHTAVYVFHPENLASFLKSFNATLRPEEIGPPKKLQP